MPTTPAQSGTSACASTSGVSPYQAAARSIPRVLPRWLRRNPVDPQGREAAVVWDSGQLHHERGHVVAVLDLELGHVGDPMMDLAASACATPSLGLRRHEPVCTRSTEARGGSPGRPRRGACTTTSRSRSATSSRSTPHSPSPRPSRLHDQHPVGPRPTCSRWRRSPRSSASTSSKRWTSPRPRVSLGRGGARAPRRSAAQPRPRRRVEQHRLRIAFRLARHLQRVDEIGDACMAADLDDLQASSAAGRRPGRRATPRSRRWCSPTTAPTTRSWWCCSTAVRGAHSRCSGPPVRRWPATTRSSPSRSEPSPHPRRPTSGRAGLLRPVVQRHLEDPITRAVSLPAIRSRAWFCAS